MTILSTLKFLPTPICLLRKEGGGILNHIYSCCISIWKEKRGKKPSRSYIVSTTKQSNFSATKQSKPKVHRNKISFLCFAAREFGQKKKQIQILVFLEKKKFKNLISRKNSRIFSRKKEINKKEEEEEERKKYTIIVFWERKNSRFQFPWTKTQNLVLPLVSISPILLLPPA